MQLPLRVSIVLCNFSSMQMCLGIAARRLLKEIDHLKKHPLTGCTAAPREENILMWTAVIEGPPNTVYEGGTFFVELSFAEDYPFVAPKVR